jgi:transposase-like protein
MSPVEVVIKVFGGVRATARALGINPGTVSRWRDTVPSKHHVRLIDLARRQGRRLTSNDLVRGRAH